MSWCMLLEDIFRVSVRFWATHRLWHVCAERASRCKRRYFYFGDTPSPRPAPSTPRAMKAGHVPSDYLPGPSPAPSTPTEGIVLLPIQTSSVDTPVLFASAIEDASQPTSTNDLLHCRHGHRLRHTKYTRKRGESWGWNTNCDRFNLDWRRFWCAPFRASYKRVLRPCLSPFRKNPLVWRVPSWAVSFCRPCAGRAVSFPGACPCTPRVLFRIGRPSKTVAIGNTVPS